MHLVECWTSFDQNYMQAAFKVPPVKFMYFIFCYTHMFGFCSVSEPPMNEKRLLLVAPLLRERVLKHKVVEISPS